MAVRNVSPDPADFSPTHPSTLNRYPYTSDDPINKIDRNGLSEEDSDDPTPVYDICSFNSFAYGCAGADLEQMGGAGSTYTRPPKDGMLLPGVLNTAKDFLDKQGCGDTIFAGGIAKGHNPYQVLAQIAYHQQYGHLAFERLDRIYAGQESQPFLSTIRFTNKVTITINTLWWNNSNTTDDQRAIVLIHELGHAFNDLFGKGSSTIEPDTDRHNIPNQDAEARNADRLKPCLQ